MYTLLNESSGNTLGIRVNATLAKEDYQRLIPVVEQKLNTYGKLNLLVHLENIEGIEPGAMWEDLKFDAKHYNDFERIAIVGRKAWMNWMTQLSKPFFKGEIKYFEPAHLAEAWRWVREKEITPESR